MAKQKVLPEPSGAEHLAAMMMARSAAMTRELPLSSLEAAPEEWNFFRPLSEDKMLELLASIEENGLLMPLIVWERGGKYRVLSGHNRMRALEMLGRRFAPCMVYERDALDEESARAILVDSNWVQRVLSPAEKAKAVYTKYVALGRMRRGAGKRGYEEVAAHFGLKATQAYQYTRLARLEPQWLDRLDSGDITIKAAAHLTKLRPEQRQFLQDLEEFPSKRVFALRENMSLEDMRALLAPESATRELRVTVKAEDYADLRDWVHAWLAEKGYFK